MLGWRARATAQRLRISRRNCSSEVPVFRRFTASLNKPCVTRVLYALCVIIYLHFCPVAPIRQLSHFSIDLKNIGGISSRHASIATAFPTLIIRVISTPFVCPKNMPLVAHLYIVKNEGFAHNLDRRYLWDTIALVMGELGICIRPGPRICIP